LEGKEFSKTTDPTSRRETPLGVLAWLGASDESATIKMSWALSLRCRIVLVIAVLFALRGQAFASRDGLQLSFLGEGKDGQDIENMARALENSKYDVPMRSEVEADRIEGLLDVEAIKIARRLQLSQGGKRNSPFVGERTKMK